MKKSVRRLLEIIGVVAILSVVFTILVNVKTKSSLLDKVEE